MKNSENSSLQKSSVIQLLKTFSKTEIREFDKFVHSPYLNNRAAVAVFFDEIKNFYPGFESRNFNKQAVFNSLYPGNRYRDDVIRRMCSNLLKLAEDYLSDVSNRKEKFNHHRNVLEQFQKKDLNNFYLRHYKKSNLFLQKSKLRNAEYFLRNSKVEEIHRRHIAKRDTTGKKTHIQNQINNVWKYSLVTLLRLYTVAIQHVNQFNKKYDLKNLPAVLKLVETSGFMEEKAIEIFYLTNRIMTDSRNDETFFRLKRLLKENHHILDNSENDMIFVALLTYCWDMNVKKGNDYSREEFELITQMIDIGILTEGGRIYSEWFMYAFLTAVKAGEITYAEKFIEQYKDLIPEAQRFNAVNHAFAELELTKHNYEEALKFLALPRYNNVNEKLRANSMYLKIYYELGRSEQFFYQVDSFKHLLKNEQSLGTELKKVRGNFVKFIQTLYKIRIGESNADISLLKKDIEDSNVFFKKWLLEKVKELMR